ncbi:hypothetical protein ACFVAE_15170 [Microbacterium sp. NPDC057659]|uniref:hypothetical protein n=1 Tax=Microbacterium sp. NPDC057659 TaxID=3346198 RepID=UPI0036726FDE
MDETRIPRAGRGYLIGAWLLALAIGAAAGLALGFLLQDLLPGVIIGVAVTVLVGVAIALGVRRSGSGTIEGAPPWTGDAGVRNNQSGSL